VATKLQIIVPVYNEGENIIHTLEEIHAKINVPNEILIIYDYEQDNTLPAIKSYIQTNGPDNIKLVKNKFGRGILNALKTGFSSADSETVLVVMADCSDDLAAVDEMFAKIEEGYDIVCGSRYIKGGEQVGGPIIKKTLSRLAGLSLHYLFRFPVHDISNSFKMYRKKIIDSIKIESQGGFEIGMEIVVKAYFAGYRITEVPSVWRERAQGESKFKIWKWLPSYLRWYLYVIKNTIFKR